MNQQEFEKQAESYVDESNFQNKIESKSKVKITQNTKGVNIEIQVVLGDEERIPVLRTIALDNYKVLRNQIKELEEVKTKSI